MRYNSQAFQPNRGMGHRKLQHVTVVICLMQLIAGEAPAWQPEASEQQRLARIQHLIVSGDLRSAASALDEAFTQIPGDPRLFNFRGVVEAQQGHFAAAESSFRKAIQSAPRFFEAYLNLGRLYQEHPDAPGAGQKALALYREILKHDSGHVQANYQAARLLNTGRSYAASLAHLSRLPPELQRRAAALALRCANNFELGRTAEGEAAAAQLLASSDFSELDVLSVAPVLLARKRDDVALRLLSTLAGKGLASPETLEKLAAIHEQRREFKQARAVLERSPALAHPSASFLSRIAQLAYRAGDLEGALGYLAHARDLEPANARIHFFFGMICVDLKLPPEAKASLREALRLEPDNPYYNYAFGAVLLSEKNADEAILHLRKYSDARPDDPRGTFALGVAYFEAYRMDAAREALLSAALRAETRMGAQLYLGRLALATGNIHEALVHFQEAIKANPRVPEAYAEAALVRIRREEYGLAQKSLSAALSLAPDHYLSNLRLLMLYQKTRDARAAQQASRVAELRKAGEEKERLLLRTLDIRPY